jgi:hypothetical protein
VCGIIADHSDKCPNTWCLSRPLLEQFQTREESQKLLEGVISPPNFFSNIIMFLPPQEISKFTLKKDNSSIFAYDFVSQQFHFFIKNAASNRKLLLSSASFDFVFRNKPFVSLKYLTQAELLKPPFHHQFNIYHQRYLSTHLSFLLGI